MRCRGVREDLIVSNVVVCHPAYVECAGIKSGKYFGCTCSKVAQDRNHSYAQHIITEPPTIWPSTGHCSFTESLLNRAREGISSEYSESIKHWVIRISCQTRRSGR